MIQLCRTGMQDLATLGISHPKELQRDTMRVRRQLRRVATVFTGGCPPFHSSLPSPVIFCDDSVPGLSLGSDPEACICMTYVRQ